MAFLSLEPFIPSGSDLDKSKKLFLELGFSITWDAGDYIGFEKDGCKFILQNFDDRAFAENLMINVRIDDAQKFWEELKEKEIESRFNVRIAAPRVQPYGTEVNLIDPAGVCWHFVE